MTKTLEELIEFARNYKPTPQEIEESKRSFAYGNVKIHNDRVTRELIDQEADKLWGEKNDDKNDQSV